MIVNDYVRLRKPLQIKDIVKGDDLLEYFIVVDSEDLGYGFPTKYYAINVFTNDTAVVYYNWHRISKFNPWYWVLRLFALV